MVDMPRLMDMGLEKLTSMILETAEMAQRCVEAVVIAHNEGSRITPQIRAWSDELRLKYNNVEDLAVELLARFQPVASDLRFIKSSMKIAYDISRLGRYAYDIALLLTMFKGIAQCNHELTNNMAKKSMDMIRKSTQAFKDRDVKLASSLVKDDDVIDDMFEHYLSTVLARKSEETIECLVSNVLIMRYLERIADHACYVADSVIYMVTGKTGRALDWT